MANAVMMCQCLDYNSLCNKICEHGTQVLDPASGSGWLPGPTMVHKRFTTASAAMGGALYAVGGYDGEHYLRSVERLDPRHGKWKLVRLSMRFGAQTGAYPWPALGLSGDADV